MEEDRESVWGKEKGEESERGGRRHEGWWREGGT